jgi:hypothetical protein
MPRLTSSVVELRARRGIAVRQVKTSNIDVADGSLNISAVEILGVPGEAASGLDRIGVQREDRDAVPRFLSVPDRAISGLANSTDWEILLGRLQFLTANDIRLRFPEPSQEHRQSAINPVHVIGRNLHGSMARAFDTVGTRGDLGRRSGCGAKTPLETACSGERMP